MTADVDLDALTRLAQAATPGPWHHEPKKRPVARVWTDSLPDDQADEIAVTIVEEDAAYIAAVSPDVVLALVERVRAAETAIERVCALAHQFAIDDAEPTTEHRTARPILDALDGPGAPAGAEVDKRYVGEFLGPQNAANEGGA